MCECKIKVLNLFPRFGGAHFTSTCSYQKTGWSNNKNFGAWPFCQLVILGIWAFGQQVILPTGHFFNCAFSQLLILSFCDLVIL
jgi:hypothetical protein